MPSMLRTLIAMVLVSATSAVAQAPAQTQANDQCSGRRLLATPRPEGSCLTARLQVHPSPDQAMRAIVWPVGMSLFATPDIESRVVIRANESKLVTSRDHSSPRGTNGYYVVRAKWSPDSRFFVYSMASSGGHSPWSFPTFVFSRDKGAIVSLNDMIRGPTVSDSFEFSGPSTLTATTWEKQGSDKHIPVVVDLEDAIRKAVP